MKLTLSHPTGNNFAKAVAYRLAKEDMLYEFFTSIAFFDSYIGDKILNLEALSELKRREFDSSIRPYTKTWPYKEIGRLFSLKLKLNFFLTNETGLFCTDAVYQSIDKHVAKSLNKATKSGVNGVYAYEDGALNTFLNAKKLDIKCIYDLPIAYWEFGRCLMREESERLPKWAGTLGGGIKDSQAKLDRKVMELELADVVIVPSQFVVDSLPSFAEGKKVILAPFGTPEVTYLSDHTLEEVKNNKSPLRVLFVGSMGQRKGLGDLFESIKLLNRSDVELVVLGSLQAPMAFYRNQLTNFTYEHGRSNEQVLQLMRSCDVFCLPSIVEGRALVMQEAMSQGLPIIITPNTGGEDLVIEGKTGFLVPVGSPEIIAEKINWFCENRSVIPEMGEMARHHAAMYTWKDYGTKIVEAIKQILL